jgi:D-lactate dehydrogenase (cytochrome)
LPQGDIVDLKRGEIFADQNGKVTLPLPSGGAITGRLPTYSMPKTRKHVSGYFVKPGMDLIDLFIGSEGTLGVVTEIEASMLEKPENVLAGIVFFPASIGLLSFVEEARSRSLSTRAGDTSAVIDARALEYFDVRALNFLRDKYPTIPTAAAGAIFFEQEMTFTGEDEIFSAWMNLIEDYGALADDSWFALNDADRARLKEFRHALPVMVNEWLVHHGQRKVSTDMAVPEGAFRSMLDFYNSRLSESGLEYVIFGHIGDCHLHVNILPRNEQEADGARALYREFIERAVALGGTVSAEHGIGKLKRPYLETLYGKEYVREMAELKKAFDPACVLGIGNLFSESYL